MKLVADSLKLLLSAVVAACAGGAGADVVMTGNGDFSYEVSADVSLAGQTMSVDPDAAVLKYPGIFAPGNFGVEEKVFRNVQLSDIASFKARIGTQDLGGGDWSWLETTMFHDSGTVDGARMCQLQVLRRDTAIICFTLVFKQEGDDVKCSIKHARYAYKSEDQVLGANYGDGGKGVVIKVLEEEHVSAKEENTYGGAAIADIECVLNDGIEVSHAPSTIVFENTDDTVPEETVTDGSFLSVGKEIIFKNVNTADVVSVSAQMGSTTRIGPDWVVANGYHRTNRVEGLEFQLQALTTKSTHGVYCVFILLTQRGSDMCAKVYCTGYPATTACWSYSDELGRRFYYDNGGGVTVALVDTMQTEGLGSNQDGLAMAVRGLSVTHRPKKRAVAVCDDCIMKEWVKLWPDTRICDIGYGSAMMGGRGVGSVWRAVSSYFPEEIEDAFYYDGTVHKRYYQAQIWNSVRSVRVGFRQEGDDVWAKVYAVTYRYPDPFVFPYDGFGDAEYSSAITNTVDGDLADSGIANTLSLCGLSAVRQARVRHTVTVNPDFNPSALPVRLHEVCLAMEVPAGDDAVLTDKVSGYCGAVAKTGAGTLSLGTDLRGSVGLEVQSGTMTISSPRETGGRLVVASGATLVFDFTSGGQTYIAAPSASFASGSSVSVKLPAQPADIEDGTEVKVVKGCGLGSEAVSGVAFSLAGGNGRYKAGLLVDADGDLAVRFRKVRGLAVSVR